MKEVCTNAPFASICTIKRQNGFHHYSMGSVFLFISVSSILFLGSADFRCEKAHYKTSIIDVDNVIIGIRHCHTVIRFQV